MTRRDITVLVGPVPPPVDGRAVATGWLIDALKDRSVELYVIDTQLPEGRLRAVRKLWTCAQAASTIVQCRPASVVVVASGGAGLVGEALPLLAATRIRRCRAFLFHHSSSYVRDPSRLLGTLVRLAGPRLHHVLLSAGMRSEFRAAYGIEGDQAHVIGNAGIMQRTKRRNPRMREATAIHLSNLSAEKGSLVAIGLAVRLGIRLCLAGPASSEVLDTLSRLPAGSTDIAWLGPLYGDVKIEALERARVLLFPTRYRHEAQPLVVYEAVDAGCVPVVWGAGWIHEQMEDLGLGEFVVEVGDIDGLGARVESLLEMDDAEFEKVARRAQEALARVCRRESNALDELATGLGQG